MKDEAEPRRVAAIAAIAGLLGVLLLALLPGVGRAQVRTVTVFAAASLGDAFRAMQGPFEKKHPGWKLQFSFAASSTLRVQIEQGAPAHVFASADQEQMQPLVSHRLAGAPKVFARNRLVVVVPASNPGKVAGVQDLARPGLRVLGTAENVPVGRYSRQVLGKLSGMNGFPRDFAARVERNLVSREANVRAVLAKIELGEGDAALVYESDAHASSRVRRFALPATANVTAAYPMAVLSDSPQRSGGEAFVQFVLSREGQAVLRRYGFR